MPKVVHFEIPADNPERAVQFYSSVFGWKIERWGGPVEYWLAMTGSESEPGINGAIMRRQRSFTSVVNSIQVPSVEDFARRVTGNGGKIIAPRQTIPGVGYIAYSQDPEGNSFGLFQPDSSAK